MSTLGEEGEEEEQWDSRKRDRAKANIQEEKHHQEKPDKGEIHQEERHLAGEEQAELVELAKALHDLAGGHALERLERLMNEVMYNFAPQRRIQL